jgi:uncharacterized protein
MNNIKLFSGLLVVALVYSSTYCCGQALKTFPLSAVRLANGPFYKAQQTDLEYILALDPDRLLAPFLQEAGIQQPADLYGNWENTGLNGHIGGHYLSALSLMVASTHDPEIMRRLNYMVDQLAVCQQKNGNGYVGGIPGGQAMWEDIKHGKIEADNFSLNKKWVPVYNIHKLFAGLRDASIVGGNKKAQDVLVRLSDWFLDITAGLSDEQLQLILKSEHGGINEIFADVAAITKEDKYLVLAKRLSHKVILDPLLLKKDVLTGLHANTQIPKVIGFKRIADISSDTTWSGAAGFFWETVVRNRTVSIGGNSVREHFHPANDFSSMVESNQGPETCNTYNMLRLTALLFLSDPAVKFVDYYERALYNHILSSQHPKGGFVYFTPMRPRHYRVYSQPQESFWCCVGSGLENHAKYGELIYAHADNALYVNLFMASTVEWKEKGITLEQRTEFPLAETSRLELKLTAPKKFALNIRYPGWVRPGQLKIAVNGKDEKIKALPSSFVSLDRTWKNGDVISVTLPMHTEIEFLPDGSAWGSFVHGPIVLAAATDSSDLAGLRADGSRMGHVAEGKFYPLEEAPMMVGTPDKLIAGVKPVAGKAFTFSARDVIYPPRYKDIKLVPFYSVHDTRYMIYWKVTTPENLERIKREIQAHEKELLALESRTVDQVGVGEQQPEADHNFKGENAEMGSTDGQPWRNARGWFSYDLRNPRAEGKILRVTFAGQGRNRKFDIFLNDRLLQTVALADAQRENPFHVDYEIPAEMIKAFANNVVSVKFVAHQGSATGRILYVRLLKTE